VPHERPHGAPLRMEVAADTANSPAWLHTRAPYRGAHGYRAVVGTVSRQQLARLLRRPRVPVVYDRAHGANLTILARLSISFHRRVDEHHDEYVGVGESAAHERAS
jgi:hypothetical protein